MKPLPPYVTFRLQFPSGPPRPPSPSSASGASASLIDYTEEEDYESLSKWNNFVLNLNGLRNGSATLHQSLEELTTPSSPPYIVAPSFEMRWPGPASKDSTAAKNPMAFQLTSHKQLDQAEQIFEELLGESDESPPYLPAKLKPSAPPLVEKPV